MTARSTRSRPTSASCRWSWRRAAGTSAFVLDGKRMSEALIRLPAASLGYFFRRVLGRFGMLVRLGLVHVSLRLFDGLLRLGAHGGFCLVADLIRLLRRRLTALFDRRADLRDRDARECHTGQYRQEFLLHDGGLLWGPE